MSRIQFFSLGVAVAEMALRKSTAILAAAAGPEDWVRTQIATLPPEVIAALWAIFRGENGSPSPEKALS